VADAPIIKSLLKDTLSYYQQGLFDDKYDNIARIAPELPEGFIYTTFGHIGSSKEQKNTGNALQRCFYAKEMTYHALAFAPEENKCIILSKNIASMKSDAKTRGQADDGGTKKKEYLVILELEYKPTNNQHDAHNLGIFTKLLRTFCGECVAGQGLCRHKSERLWFQYHYWTDERLGIERPSTIDACSWAPGKTALTSDVRAKIHQQQNKKLAKSLEDQQSKMERNVKRDCTEGQVADYSVYPSAAKQQKHSKQFTYERCKKLFDLIREQSEE
jgi:hypothetical protein